MDSILSILVPKQGFNAISQFLVFAFGQLIHHYWSPEDKRLIQDRSCASESDFKTCTQSKPSGEIDVKNLYQAGIFNFDDLPEGIGECPSPIEADKLFLLPTSVARSALFMLTFHGIPSAESGATPNGE